MPDCAPIAYSATSPGLTAAAQVLRDAVAARLFPSAVACFGIGAHVETIAVGHARVRPERV
ncbi:MAG TPA: hypothetical protein PKB10_08405, partial [Tepidisphaeraceae bacterium]|nr:hypothetical protein [Tepidisphaeraceae bacterium]